MESRPPQTRLSLPSIHTHLDLISLHPPAVLVRPTSFPPFSRNDGLVSNSDGHFSPLLVALHQKTAFRRQGYRSQEQRPSHGTGRHGRNVWRTDDWVLHLLKALKFAYDRITDATVPNVSPHPPGSHQENYSIVISCFRLCQVGLLDWETKT